MKKVLKILQILIIALWPIVFLLTIGPVESQLRLLASQTYKPLYTYYTVIIYAVSGCLFAVSGSCGKDGSWRRVIAGAHIVAGASVLLFFILWAVDLATGIFFSTAGNILTSLNWNVLALVFGFTLCSAIRAIVLCRKKTT